MVSNKQTVQIKQHFKHVIKAISNKTKQFPAKCRVGHCLKHTSTAKARRSDTERWTGALASSWLEQPLHVKKDLCMQKYE